MVGNLPHFREFDVLRTFLYIEEGISRQELTKKLGLGEGTLRSILDILKKKELIASTQQGHVHTQKGKELLKEIEKIISKPKEVKLPFNKLKNIGLVLKTKDKIDVNYKIRDLAVKNGAEGALFLTYNNGLCLDFECEEKFDYLEKEFSLEKNNLLIITFAESIRNAETALLAVAVELSDKLKEISKLD